MFQKEGYYPTDKSKQHDTTQSTLKKSKFNNEKAPILVCIEGASYITL